MRLWRLRTIQMVFLGAFAIIYLRLVYWQIFASAELAAIAQVQHQSTISIPASRGRILATDGFPLVSNEPAYLTYAYKPDIEKSPQELSDLLGPIIAPTPDEVGATPSAEVAKQLLETTKSDIKDKLSNPSLSWVPLKRVTNTATKNRLESLGINGLGFEEFEARSYPEASMAAQLLGFVGSDGSGNPKGYFGLEGKYDVELTGKPGIIRQEKDAFGRPLVIGDFVRIEGRNGRTLKTHIDRGLQFIVERSLKEGLEKYGAMSGEVVVMDPKTGAIKAMAAFPSYANANFRRFDNKLYRIPSIAESYEPGSTFKTLVMAAGIDAKVIEPNTTCNEPCRGPVNIGKYTIRTWNNEYHPGQTMTEVLERSDNTGMIYVANSLGKERFIDYIKRFGIGAPTNVDLEEELIPSLRKTWGDIDLATGSFGQGLAVTSLQMVTAVGALANEGNLMEPHVVSEIIADDRVITIKPKLVRQVVSKETAQKMAVMMEASAAHGDAKWAIPKGYRIAGKTGTAQIPIQGHYDEEKTMASFVGFAPAEAPRFVMLVKLREPQTSPWASETAAPLWFQLAKELFYYLNIPPSP